MQQRRTHGIYMYTRIINTHMDRKLRRNLCRNPRCAGNGTYMDIYGNRRSSRVWLLFSLPGEIISNCSELLLARAKLVKCMRAGKTDGG